MKIISKSLMNVSKNLMLTESKSVCVTFEKIENETLFYTMQIAGIKVHLTVEPSKKPTVEEIIRFKLSEVDIATKTFYKLLMIDELVQLSEINDLVEFEMLYLDHYSSETWGVLFPDPLGDFPKKCICGGAIWPIYDDNPHFGSFCDKCD